MIHWNVFVILLPSKSAKSHHGIFIKHGINNAYPSHNTLTCLSVLLIIAETIDCSHHVRALSQICTIARSHPYKGGAHRRPCTTTTSISCLICTPCIPPHRIAFGVRDNTLQRSYYPYLPLCSTMARLIHIRYCVLGSRLA
jgi:hypothetical protein